MNGAELQEAYSYIYTLPCGDATLPPLEKELEAEGVVADENQRYGDISVLNAEHPTDQMNRLLVELDQGYATIIRQGYGKCEVIDERLQGKTVIVKGEISHMVEGKPDEFAGWFIAEEFAGDDYDRHPFLLLAPSQVEKL